MANRISPRPHANSPSAIPHSLPSRILDDALETKLWKLRDLATPSVFPGVNRYGLARGGDYVHGFSRVRDDFFSGIYVVREIGVGP
jgi:hypothetical protein